jgi:biopolymer transport protein TolQ
VFTSTAVITGLIYLVLALLFISSIITLTIIGTKVLQFRRVFGESARFLDFFWQTRRFDAIASQLDRFGHSPLAAIFREGYNELRKSSNQSEQKEESAIPTAELTGIDQVSRALRRAINQETTRLEKYTTFLATTGSTAPFVGLFGTVLGIMNSFTSIGETGSASLAVVAPGISHALFATAVGLFAAIPAVVAYNHFQNRIRIVSAEMDNFSAELLNIVQRSLGKRQG